MSSRAHAQRLRLRGFLEGIEVPVISAQVTASPNTFATAAIQIPPLAEGTRLLPRTLLHLYFADLYEAESPFISEQGASAQQPEKEQPGTHDPGATQEESSLEKAGSGEGTGDAEHDQSINSKSTRYKLLFVGEVVGFAWSKNSMQRSLILQAVDLSNYWDYAYQWTNTDIFGPSAKAVFSGGATNLFTDFLSSKGSVLTNIVSSGKCNAFPNLSGLAAGLVRLIEAIGGTYAPKPGSGGKKYAGQNLFYSIAELRLRLTAMITAYENDPTSKRILNRQGYSGMYDRALGGQGEQTSIRQAINALAQVMFYEVYPQPCPKYVPGSEGRVSGRKRVSVRGHPKWDFVATDSDAAIKTIQNASLTLSQISAGATEGTEVGAALTDKAREVKATLAKLQQSLFQTKTKIYRTKAPEPSGSAFSMAAQAVGIASARMANWRPKSSEQIRNKVTDKLVEAVKQLQRVQNLVVLDPDAKSVAPARLLQQILRPDIWFGAPPRCNVMFPDSYISFQYAKMFLQEPTRFLLKTNDEFFGEDALFDKYYFAPQAGTTKADHARLRDLMRGEVLDHELFTGILPVFEKMGEFNVFAARNEASTGETKGDIPKVSFAQRSANFLYFKHRFNARQAKLISKFNPYVAVGFPGLVIDKWVDLATLAAHNDLRQQLNLPTQELAELMGTNFLGNFMQVDHNVSQQDGAPSTTTIDMNFCRQPEESVEFLGALDTVKRVQTREDKDAVRSTDIAALNPPRLYALGPNGGRITQVADVTAIYRRGTQRLQAKGSGDYDPDELGVSLPLFDPASPTSSVTKNAERVVVGVPISAASVSSLGVQAVADDRERLVTFRAFKVTEEIPRYRQEEVMWPAEELIRPGWYGQIWSPGQIGKVYQDFFDTGAITDPQQVSVHGASGGMTSEAMEEATAEQDRAESTEDPRDAAPIVTALEEGSSIQEAVEFLHLTYSHIKNSGMDVDEFIRAYTWRPIATMLDLFGTDDLEFTKDGEQIVRGIEGFHSRAFGEYENLFALVTPEIEDILGIKRGQPPAQKGDTRLRKYRAVQAYATALRFSRAILG